MILDQQISTERSLLQGQETSRQEQVCTSVCQTSLILFEGGVSGYYMHRCFLLYADQVKTLKDALATLEQGKITENNKCMDFM